MANKNGSIIFLIIIAVAVIAFFIFKGTGTTTKPNDIMDKGVNMQFVIVDGQGNIQSDLDGNPASVMSVISAPTNPSGYTYISPPDCGTGPTCRYLALVTQLDNTAGGADITVTKVDAKPTILSVAGSPPATRRGNLNEKYAAILASDNIIEKGTKSPTVTSDGMSLEEFGNGIITFTVEVSGYYYDAYGNQQPLTTTLGSKSLMVAPSVCTTDNTLADPDSSDADVATYCSATSKPKYCRIGNNGQPAMTDNAAVCGCPTGQHIVGSVCKLDTQCTAGQCIAGSVLYCVGNGVVQTRCKQCAGTNYITLCPLSALGQQAVGCNPDTSNVESQCVYPAVSANGFTVYFGDVTFLQATTPCGDKVKAGTEQCDGTDFGGMDCTQAPPLGIYSGGVLGCTTNCLYDISQCAQSFVKFRTMFKEISNLANTDGIADI